MHERNEKLLPDFWHGGRLELRELRSRLNGIVACWAQSVCRTP